MRLWTRIALFGLGCTLAACGGGGGSTAPSTATITSISVISTSSQVLLGASETFSAQVTRSDGSTQTVTGVTWSTDAPGVATVGASTGSVTGVKSGSATISIDYSGLHGSKLIAVRPNYSGIWSGNYTVNACTETGAWAAAPYDACTSTFTTNAVYSDALSIQQSLSAVTGQTALASNIIASFALATIQGDGSVVLNASFPAGTTGTIAQVWSLNITTPGQLIGTLVQTWSDTTVTGQMVVTTTLGTHSVVGAAPSALHTSAKPSGWLDVLRAFQK